MQARTKQLQLTLQEHETVRLPDEVVSALVGALAELLVVVVVEQERDRSVDHESEDHG